MWVGKKLRKKDAVLPPVEIYGTVAPLVGPGNSNSSSTIRLNLDLGENRGSHSLAIQTG